MAEQLLAIFKAACEEENPSALMQVKGAALKPGHLVPNFVANFVANFVELILHFQGSAVSGASPGLRSPSRQS
jgi:hypothetical protein